MSDPNTLQLTTKASQNLEKVMGHKMNDFLDLAAPNVRADSGWLARAKFELVSKPETSKLMTTTRGLETAVYAIMRAATVGITFGGTKPQAYFVPAGDGVRLDVSQYGYAHAAVHGPGAVLSHIPELIKVHQNDGIRMDQAEGTIYFPDGGIDPFGDRGQLMGYMMRLEYKDGRRPQVVAIAQAKVKEISDRYGQTQSPAYKKSPEEMFEKIAVKQLLKRAYAESEGNAQYALDTLEDPMPPEAKIERDPKKRMADRIERATASMKPVDVDPIIEVETVQEAEEAPKEEKILGKEELF